MKIISSRTNPEVKHLVLLQTKKYRMLHGQFIAEGMRTCKTLIEHGHVPLSLYVTDQQRKEAAQLVAQNRITLVNDHVMEKISSATMPSGVLGLFTIPPAAEPSQLSHGLVLAQLTDPGNMGTLMRTAAALNAPSIVLIEGVDPWNAKVVQASAGTIGMLTLFQWSWQDLLAHKGNKKLYALTISGGKNPRDISLKNSLLVVGSEAHGIPQDWVNACDEKITLPMPGGTESLNAAVAGSIALYVASE